jgi:hypothetical protein
MEIVIIILVFIQVFTLVALYDMWKAVRKLQTEDIDQSYIIIKLMYHRAKEIEDYEILAEIDKKMPKEFDPYKF